MDNAVIKAALVLVLVAGDVLAGSVHGFSVPPSGGSSGFEATWPRRTGASSTVDGDDGYFAAGYTNWFNPDGTDCCTNNADGLTITHEPSRLEMMAGMQFILPDNPSGINEWGYFGHNVYKYTDMTSNLCPYQAGFSFAEAALPTWAGWNYRVFCLVSNGVYFTRATLTEELADHPSWWVEAPFAAAYNLDSSPANHDWRTYQYVSDAIAVITNMTFAGHSDWRMANSTELMTLWRGGVKDNSKYLIDAVMDGTYIPMDGWMSCTPNAGDGKYFGVVYSGNGISGYGYGPKAYAPGMPLAVRGGKVNAHEGE